MVFIETPLFTKLFKDMLSDEEYRKLQQILLLRPDAGKIIKGSGGLRKIRWNLPGFGKRGGLRIIYYWDRPNDVIYMLLSFKKNRQEDLTHEQLSILRNFVKEWLNE